MTVKPAQATATAAAAANGKPKPAAGQAKPSSSKALPFLPPVPDIGSDDQKAYQNLQKLYKRITRQSVAVLVLTLLFILAMPFFQTRYVYVSTTPEHAESSLVGLTIPNLTTSAIKSWAASGVTEILTIGFGDFNDKLVAQRERFTTDGWNDFVHMFLDKKIGEQFRQNQLVLTTAPSADPTIVSEGPNPQHVYQWVVKVPVIMTYATNNNRTEHQEASITLVLVRVPYEVASRGVAIDSWRQ
jgi:intracellular multiplication protein IcmL